MFIEMKGLRIFVYQEVIDMRCGFEKLTHFIRDRMKSAINQGHLYIFLGKNRRRLKALFFDGTGLVMISKRIERGRFMAHGELMQFWDRVEAESFLRFANEKYPKDSSERWIYVVYLLALNTGLRAGEIWGLQPRDLISASDMFFIRRQFDRVKKAYGIPKGKKSRHVPCHENLRIEIQNLIDACRTRLDQSIFHGETGLPINHDSFGGNRFDKDVRLWGGRRIRFHDLRHTAATLMIGLGVDLKTVKEIFGHKDIATTMNYAHLLGDNLKQVARTFSVSPSVQPEANLNGAQKGQSRMRLVIAN